MQRGLTKESSFIALYTLAQSSSDNAMLARKSAQLIRSAIGEASISRTSFNALLEGARLLGSPLSLRRRNCVSRASVILGAILDLSGH